MCAVENVEEGVGGIGSQCMSGPVRRVKSGASCTYDDGWVVYGSLAFPIARLVLFW